MDAGIFGIALLAAGFLLSWGEAAEQHISQGLILAAVALVPRAAGYALDLYYAYRAGRAGPESQYVHFAATNKTGPRANAVEAGFLLLASFYAFVILFKARITLLDFLVLAATWARTYGACATCRRPRSSS